MDRSWFRKSIILAFLIALVVIAGIMVKLSLPSVYKSLSVQRLPKQTVDVIVVLSGDRGERVRYAVDLYNRGLGRKMLMSGGPLLHTSDAALMKVYAVQLGVPSENILIEDESLTTYENAQKSFLHLQADSVSSILVVTSEYHTRRSAWTFRQVKRKLNMDIDIYVAGAPDYIAASDWWRNPDAIETVGLEWSKVIWYWLRYRAGEDAFDE